jgi:signal transduction histidine kinase
LGFPQAVRTFGDVDRSEGPLPLAEGIRRLLEDIVESGGIAGHLDDRLREELSAETRAVAYNIVRDALINVRHHSDADSVVISLESQVEGTLVTIEDDGTGFDPKTAFALQDDHLGLKVMRERAQKAGGWLRVDSAFGEGATIRFWIPSSVASD